MPMKVAMAILGVLSMFGGLVQVPGVDDVIEKFLAGSFLDSTLYEVVVPDRRRWEGLAIGGVIAITGISLAYYCYVVAAGGHGPRCAERLRAAAHASSSTSGTSTSSTTRSSTGPTIAVGRFANDVVERVVVQGIVNGTVDVVRGVGVGRARQPSPASCAPTRCC